jgi:hypothetical protein
MWGVGRIRDLLRHLRTRMARKGVQLNDMAERLLKEAEGRGYRVTR